MKTVTRLLVGPPTSRGHSLKAHHELQAGRIHHKNPKTQFWHNSGNVKTKNREKRVLSPIQWLFYLFFYLTINDHLSGIYNIYKPSGRPQEGRTTSKFGKIQ
jgi:hypothetical protein